MEDTKKQSGAGEFAETQETPEAGHEELSNIQLEEVSAGWGDIQGGSTDDKHKDW